jgi:ClpP class serine protease
LLISEIISRHKGQTTAKITYNAFSGGTIIALVRNKIKMTRAAAVTCIDPQSSYIGSIRHAKEPLAMATTQSGLV